MPGAKHPTNSKVAFCNITRPKEVQCDRWSRENKVPGVSRNIVDDVSQLPWLGEEAHQGTKAARRTARKMRPVRGQGSGQVQPPQMSGWLGHSLIVQGNPSIFSLLLSHLERKGESGLPIWHCLRVEVSMPNKYL